MRLKKTLARLAVAAATFAPMTAYGEAPQEPASAQQWASKTVQQWVANNKNDPAVAMQELRQIYGVQRDRAIEHYNQTGDTARATIVKSIDPNMIEVAGRIKLVAYTQDKPVDVNGVVLKYIVDVSAQLLAAQKQPASAR